MSLVLGPVHHWMYKKIQTTEAREAFIVDALKDKYGQEAEEILNSITRNILFLTRTHHLKKYLEMSQFTRAYKI